MGREKERLVVIETTSLASDTFIQLQYLLRVMLCMR